jgi:hypothetical protein
MYHSTIFFSHTPTIKQNIGFLFACIFLIKNCDAIRIVTKQLSSSDQDYPKLKITLVGTNEYGNYEH